MIYDLQGQLIKTIVSAANNEMIITSEKMQKGLYIYTLSGDKKLLTVGKILLK